MASSSGDITIGFKRRSSKVRATSQRRGTSRSASTARSSPLGSSPVPGYVDF